MLCRSRWRSQNACMHQGTLELYTDASVQGERWQRVMRSGKWQTRRSRIGPSMVGWIGWHDCEPATRPNVAGQAYVGRRGTQGAEYQALISGLHATLAYVCTTGTKPERVVVGIDNAHVWGQMIGNIGVDA